MSALELAKGIDEKGFEFLRNYPPNFGFFVYGTHVGNRLSIEVYYTPDKELKQYGQWHRWKPSGFEIGLGTVHVVLAFKDRGDPRPKIDKLVQQAPIFERIARKYGYPFEGLWGIRTFKDEEKNKILRKQMIAELKETLKRK